MLSFRSHTRPLSIAITIVLSAAIAGCGSGGGSPSTSAPAEAQSAASGDIPDNQRFLAYRNANEGYSIKYPEGWARTGSAADVAFNDKDNRVEVAVASGSAPTAQQAQTALERSAAGLKAKTAQTEKIAGTRVLHLTYETQGRTDPVTGKRLTAMIDRYIYASGGKVATLDESTPVGVDNVDAFRLIAQSFRWN